MMRLCLAALATAASAEVFVVTDHGAKGDGRTRDDAAIAATFAACSTASSTAGPREVLFPAPGTYITGPWELACNDSVVTVEEAIRILTDEATPPDLKRDRDVPLS